MADHLIAGLHCEDAADLAASFVLGALDPGDADKVRAHLASCPEGHPEFAELGSVVPALFETVELVAPPPALRDRILATAAADKAREQANPASADHAGRSTAEPATALAAPRSPVPGLYVPRPGIFRRPIWAAVALAAALVVVALGAWNLQLRDEINGLTTYRNAVAAVLDQAARPDARLAVLASTDARGPTGLAVVTGDGAAVSLVMHDLVPTSGAQVYEAWLIAGTNQPVPLGSFTVGSTGVATFTATGAVGSAGGTGLAVALTREPGPGATAPTLPIIASGAAG